MAALMLDAGNGVSDDRARIALGLQDLTQSTMSGCGMDESDLWWGAVRFASHTSQAH
jgi:hypothetical protein